MPLDANSVRRQRKPLKRACCINSREQGHTYILGPGHLYTSTRTHTSTRTYTSTRWSAYTVVRGNIYSSTCGPQPNCDMRNPLKRACWMSSQSVVTKSGTKSGSTAVSMCCSHESGGTSVLPEEKKVSRAASESVPTFLQDTRGASICVCTATGLQVQGFCLKNVCVCMYVCIRMYIYMY